MQDQPFPTSAERYKLIGDLKQFWRDDDDAMHKCVDLDGLAAFIHESASRRMAMQEFPVLSLSRADIAMAFMDDDDNEPDWPYTLTDSQMQALAIRIQQWLTFEDIFWDCIRDFARDLALVGGEAKLPAQSKQEAA